MKCKCKVDHSNIKITRRWRDVATKISKTNRDVIEVDYKYYVMVPSDEANEDIEYKYCNNKYHGLYTALEFAEYGVDHASVLADIAFCGCGGNVLISAHSQDCEDML